jgi:hypothetical protein
MRPKDRGLTQHGGPPGWLEESDPARDIHDGRFKPPALVCSCSDAILANRDAVADVLVLVAQKTRHEPYQARKAWVKTLVRPLPSLWNR